MTDDKKRLYMEKMTDDLPALRKLIGVSQARLAQMIGVSLNTIGNIERGRQKMSWNVFVALLTVVKANPKTSRLLEVMELYDRDLNAFLSGENDPIQDV